jgi:hypothetical protein
MARLKGVFSEGIFHEQKFFERDCDKVHLNVYRTRKVPPRKSKCKEVKSLAGPSSAASVRLRNLALLLVLM